MKIGIIVAMRKELDLLLPLLDNLIETRIRNLQIFEGRIGHHHIAATISGIGKVNSALSTLSLLEGFLPDLVINSGVAGGADPSMHILDVLVATDVAYHDVWCGPGTEYGAAYGFDTYFKCSNQLVECARELELEKKPKFGLICSGDKFISKPEEIEEIKEHFPQALAVDMESAAIAQICTMKGVEFGIIRVISDNPTQEDNISQYKNFWQDAPAQTFELLRQLISRLK